MRLGAQHLLEDIISVEVLFFLDLFLGAVKLLRIKLVFWFLWGMAHFSSCPGGGMYSHAAN